MSRTHTLGSPIVAKGDLHASPHTIYYRVPYMLSLAWGGVKQTKRGAN